MEIYTMENSKPENAAIYSTTSVIGVLLSLACFELGRFAALRGYTPTPGHFIQAIGKDMLWRPSGTEDAFTIIF